MRLTERVRREVLVETGVDFGRYRTKDLAARLDLWGLGSRVGLDLLASMVAGVAAAVAVVALSNLVGVDRALWWLVAVGATAIGAAALALVASARFVRRASTEVDTVFRLAGEVAQAAAGDLEKATGSVDAVVRGLVMVSAIPLVADVASRRFLVLAPVVRRVVEVVAGRVMDRSLPAIPVATRAPGPMLHRLAERIPVSHAVVSRGVGRAARWVVMPFRVWGVVIGTTGAFVAAAAFALGVQPG